MRPLETTRSLLRTGAFCAAACLAACRAPLKEVGTPPEGPLRETETPWTRDARARAEAERDRQLDAASSPSKRESAVVDERRWVTPDTHRFHRAGCSELDASPPATRREFPNAWACLNEDFVPCPLCQPGP